MDRSISMYVHVCAGNISFDNSVVLWRASGDCNNYGVLTGHKGAILDLQWSRDPAVLFSASADAAAASWDVETGQRIRRHYGHDDVINTLEVNKQGAEILLTGSDDGTVGVWLISLPG